MLRTQFEQHLTELRHDILDLGSRAEQAIRKSMESLRRREGAAVKKFLTGAAAAAVPRGGSTRPSSGAP